MVAKIQDDPHRMPPQTERAQAFAQAGRSCYRWVNTSQTGDAMELGGHEPNRDVQASGVEAIGPIQSLPAPWPRALQPDVDFEPLPSPGPDDWLALHQEEGQTVEAFVEAAPPRPDDMRQRIYLQPLGFFPVGESPPVDRLGQFIAAFFGMDVTVLPIIDWEEGTIRSRNHAETGRQVLSKDLLALLKSRRPADAFCLLGITMDDLYPAVAGRTVFGDTSLDDGVGVYSFTRYQARHQGEAVGETERVIVERSCKVLAHQVGHMFGMTHCVYYRCLMNGAAHTAESDRRPLHFCPVDLRKLAWARPFDPVERYERLLEFCQAERFEKEAAWFARRLERIG